MKRDYISVRKKIHNRAHHKRYSNGSKLIKSHSVYLIREMQINTKIRFQYIAPRRLKLKRQY